MTDTYPEFPHRAGALSAYIFSIDIFIINLKNDDLVRFTPIDPAAFQQWLDAHGVRNVNDQLGKMVHEHYFGKR